MRRRIAEGMLAAGLAMMVAAGVGCRRYPPPVPIERLNPAQAAGRVVFNTRCAQCHYDRVDQPKNGPSLVSVFRKQSLHSGAATTDERVTATVERGHGMMPAMAGQVDGQDMSDLLAYLHTL